MTCGCSHMKHMGSQCAGRCDATRRDAGRRRRTRAGEPPRNRTGHSISFTSRMSEKKRCTCLPQRMGVDRTKSWKTVGGADTDGSSRPMPGFPWISHPSACQLCERSALTHARIFHAHAHVTHASRALVLYRAVGPMRVPTVRYEHVEAERGDRKARLGELAERERRPAHEVAHAHGVLVRGLHGPVWSAWRPGLVLVQMWQG
jgi:hypothetical protein